jgi:hypothetical protein
MSKDQDEVKVLIVNMLELIKLAQPSGRVLRAAICTLISIKASDLCSSCRESFIASIINKELLTVADGMAAAKSGQGRTFGCGH